MTIFQESKEIIDLGVFNSSTPEGLSAIHRPECMAAIWERRPLPRFQKWIDNLPPERLPSARVILRSDLVCEALANIARSCGTPEDPERDLLIDDAAALAAIFADIMRVDYLRVHLGVVRGDDVVKRNEVVRGNAYGKFHLGAVTARLVCVYRGADAKYGISSREGEPRPALTVPIGSPIILRGVNRPGTSASRLLQLSSLAETQAERAGDTRLVLALDPVVDPANEADRDFIH